MQTALIFFNGFLSAAIVVVLIAVGFGLWKIRQGWLVLQGIQQVHNELTESVAKVDGKASEALLRLDHINNLFGSGKGPL